GCGGGGGGRAAVDAAPRSAPGRHRSGHGHRAARFRRRAPARTADLAQRMNRNLLLDTVRTRVIAAAKAVYHAPVNRLAPWARRAHNRTRFIGSTGSAGKPTAKDLTHRILAVRFRTRKSPDSNNSLYIASRAMLTLPPRTEFMIQEVGARE